MRSNEELKQAIETIKNDDSLNDLKKDNLVEIIELIIKYQWWCFIEAYTNLPLRLSIDVYENILDFVYYDCQLENCI